MRFFKIVKISSSWVKQLQFSVLFARFVCLIVGVGAMVVIDCFVVAGSGVVMRAVAIVCGGVVVIVGAGVVVVVACVVVERAVVVAAGVVVVVERAVVVGAGVVGAGVVVVVVVRAVVVTKTGAAVFANFPPLGSNSSK